MKYLISLKVSVENQGDAYSSLLYPIVFTIGLYGIKPIPKAGDGCFLDTPVSQQYTGSMTLGHFAPRSSIRDASLAAREQ